MATSSSSSRKGIYLVGTINNQITGSKLPSKRDVLSVLFWNLRTVGLNLSDSASLVVDEVLVYWRKARIPTQHRSNCINKLRLLYDELRNLEKSAKRNTTTQNQREIDFEANLNDLFDIATSNALNEIKIAEDREFLVLQRQKGRVGCMLGIDVKLARVEKRREERIDVEENKKRRYAIRNPDNSCKEVDLALMECSEGNDNQVLTGNNDDDIVIDDNAQLTKNNEGSSRIKRGTKTLMTPRLAAALDKSRVSDRDSVHILSAVLDALSLDPSEYVLNRSSIKRSREKYRAEKYSSIKSSEIKVDFVELHWDSKLLADISQNKNIDRLPVIAVSLDFEQLLGVPGITSSSGSEVCSAVFDIANDWNLTDKIQAFCFDTTASNTGRINGAAALLEQTLGRSVLWLPCRHHIFEVVLAGVFLQTKVIVTSGPNITLFKNFKDKWETIDKTEYLDFTTDASVYCVLKNISEDIIIFAKQKLEEQQPRDDYKEFLLLTLIFLGEKTNVNFRAPGAYHLARWMSKAIYCLKIFLFRNQFHLKEEVKKSLGDICVFLVYCYIKPWFSAPDTIEAPLNDINFLKSLLEFQEINHTISTIALKKFLNHLWYLNEECAAFTIFDNRIGNVEKQRMAEKLIDLETTVITDSDDENDLIETTESEKKLCLKLADVSNFISKDIPTDLLSVNSLRLFKRFNISTNFLYNDPAQWELDEQYQKGRKILSALKTVNDVAERGVKLMQEYNDKFTKNEKQKQFLLQVVQEYRKKYPMSTKDSMLSTMEIKKQ